VTNRAQNDTSENAGAAIFLYFFHSTPSEATMFGPKTFTTLYRNKGLGNLARYVVISYEARSKTPNPADTEQSLSRRTLMATASATCMMQLGTGNTEICKLYCFEFQLPVKYTRKATIAKASCPAVANTVFRVSDSFPRTDCHAPVPSCFLLIPHVTPRSK